jgi:lipid A ethanolaminephosphotransferase
MNETPIRPFSLTVIYLVPALVLLWVAVYPPYSLNLAISHLFGSADGFFMNRMPVMLFLHKVARVVPIASAAAVLLTLIVTFLRGGNVKFFGADRRRMFYLLAAMLASVMLIKFLKQTTGVYCPTHITDFGGTEAVSAPILSWVKQPGHCWPSGFAGTGFCMFALYFALRDVNIRAARKGFALALGLGVFCSVVQIMRGEHFLSDTIASGVIDWLVCASLYALFFGKGIVRMVRERGHRLAFSVREA